MAGDMKKLWELVSKNLPDEIRHHIKPAFTSPSTVPQCMTENILKDLCKDLVHYTTVPNKATEDLDNLYRQQEEASSGVVVIVRDIGNAKLQLQECQSKISKTTENRKVSREEIRRCEAAFKRCEERCKDLEGTIQELKDQIRRAEEKLVELRFNCYSKGRERLEIQLGKRGTPDMLAGVDREVAVYEREVRNTENYISRLKDSVTQNQKRLNGALFERDGVQKMMMELAFTLNVHLQELKKLDVELGTLQETARQLDEQRIRCVKNNSLLAKLILKLTFISSLLTVDQHKNLRIQAVDVNIDDIK